MKYDEYHFDPSSEYTPPAKEYPSVEKQQQQKDKKKRTRRRFLLMLSAFVCSGAILFSEPVPAQEPAPQPTPIVVEASSPVPTHTPKPTPEPTEEPSVPLPTAALYPLNGGTLYLSVYGDAFDFETFDNLLLAREEIAIAQFDQGYAYSLPACPPQEGFLFMGDRKSVV